MTTHAEAVKGHFGTISHRYETANHLLSWGRDRSWRRRAVALLENRAEHLLDVACGTHALGRELERQDKACHLHAADFCAAMLEAGRLDQPAMALPCIADGHHLPYASGSMQAVTCAFGWRNASDPQRLLQEMLRVLVPGGQLLLLDFFRPQGFWPKRFQSTYGRFVVCTVGGLMVGSRAPYRHLHRSIATFHTPAKARRMLEASGLVEQRWLSLTGGICHAVCARKDASA